MSLRRLPMKIFYKKHLTLFLWLLLALTGATGISLSYAADFRRVNNTDTLDIPEFSVCKSVTNNSGKDLFIPTKTSMEWTRFYNRPPAGVTIGDCSGGASPICGDGICNGSETNVSCSVDCNCGDGICNGAETNASCPGDCLAADECAGKDDGTACGIRSCDDTNIARDCVDGKKDGWEDCWVYAWSCSGGTCSGPPLSTTTGPGATCRYGICNTEYTCNDIGCPDYQCSTNAQCPPSGGLGVSSDYDCGPSTDCQCLKNCVGARAACSPAPFRPGCCSDAGACGTGYPRTCGGPACGQKCDYVESCTCAGGGSGTKICHGENTGPSSTNPYGCAPSWSKYSVREDCDTDPFCDGCVCP